MSQQFGIISFPDEEKIISRVCRALTYSQPMNTFRMPAPLLAIKDVKLNVCVIDFYQTIKNQNKLYIPLYWMYSDKKKRTPQSARSNITNQLQ